MNSLAYCTVLLLEDFVKPPGADRFGLSSDATHETAFSQKCQRWHIALLPYHLRNVKGHEKALNMEEKETEEKV